MAGRRTRRLRRVSVSSSRLGTGHYWTRDQAAGNSRWFVEFVEGNPGTQNANTVSPFRCLYQVP